MASPSAPLPCICICAQQADLAPPSSSLKASVRPRAASSPSLASFPHTHAHPRALDSKRQDVFSGCQQRRPLLPLPMPAPSPAAPESSGRRGRWCGASMSSSGFNSPRRHDSESEEYIEAHVMQAVCMVPCESQLYMKMADNSVVEVEHVNPSAGRLLYPSAMPTMFLRMADTTNLLLPIVVGELAIGFLLKAFRRASMGRRESMARPSYYELIKELALALHSQVKHVKITERVRDTYYARIYFAKPGSAGLVSVDARPSDAINMAVRAQVPIFVSKAIVQNDAVRVVCDPSHHGPAQPRKPAVQAHLDRNIPGPDEVAHEIGLIRAMQVAAREERYSDAARLRDQLNALRGNARGRAHLRKL